MSHPIPHGITTPVPGQEKEEPDLWSEDDIPTDDRGEGQGDEEGDRSAPLS